MRPEDSPEHVKNPLLVEHGIRRAEFRWSNPENRRRVTLAYLTPDQRAYAVAWERAGRSAQLRDEQAAESGEG